MENVQEVVKRSVTEVFESMYFMFPEWPEEHTVREETSQGYFASQVGTADHNDLVILYASKRLVMKMAEGFLGTSEPIENDSLADVFKEACNVIAGNIVNCLDLNTDIALGTPTVRIVTDEDEVAKRDGRVLSVDGEFFKIAVNSDILSGCS